MFSNILFCLDSKTKLEIFIFKKAEFGIFA